MSSPAAQLASHSSNRRGRWPAVALSSLVFAAVHLALAPMPLRIAVGIMLAVAVMVTGTLRSSILLHVTINAVGVGGALLLREAQPELPAPTAGWLVATALLTASGLLSWLALMIRGWRRLGTAAPRKATPAPLIPQ